MPSSVIAWMSYDPGTQVLEMGYREGRGTYRYFNVPRAEWEAFMLAPSKGTYLNEVFKKKEYVCRKVVGWSRLRGDGLLHWPRAEERKTIASTGKVIEMHRRK
jgi:hypothetical protein